MCVTPSGSPPCAIFRYPKCPRNIVQQCVVRFPNPLRQLGNLTTARQESSCIILLSELLVLISTIWTFQYVARRRTWWVDMDMRSGKRMDMVGSSPQLQLAAWCHSPCFKPIPILIDDHCWSGFISGWSRSAGIFTRWEVVRATIHTTKDHLELVRVFQESSRWPARNAFEKGELYVDLWSP